MQRAKIVKLQEVESLHGLLLLRNLDDCDW
jgi:hypothetical protein